MTKDLMTPLEAAKAARLSTGTLAKFRVAGGGPRFVKLGARVLYGRDDLVAWIESRKHRSTAEYVQRAAPATTGACKRGRRS